MSDWTPEVREVPEELTPNFDHATFTPEPTIGERMTGVPLLDRLDDVMRHRLLELAKAVR